MGAGSRSGRRAGYCAGFNTPGYANPEVPAGLRKGMAHRRGVWGSGPIAGGRGWRHRFFATDRPDRMYFDHYPAPAQPFDAKLEKEFLKKRSQSLQSELDDINKRLENMDSNS